MMDFDQFNAKQLKQYRLDHPEIIPELMEYFVLNI